VVDTSVVETAAIVEDVGGMVLESKVVIALVVFVVSGIVVVAPSVVDIGTVAVDVGGGVVEVRVVVASILVVV
jgi:purine nucleoside permease